MNSEKMMRVGICARLLRLGCKLQTDQNWRFRWGPVGGRTEETPERVLQAVRTGSGITDLRLPSVGSQQEKEVQGRFSKATNRRDSGGCPRQVGTWAPG